METLSRLTTSQISLHSVVIFIMFCDIFVMKEEKIFVINCQVYRHETCIHKKQERVWENSNFKQACIGLQSTVHSFSVLQACGFECLRHFLALNLTFAVPLVDKSWPKLNSFETGCVNKNIINIKFNLVTFT